MKNLIIILTGGLLCLLLSCCAPTRKAAVEKEQITEVHDSLRIEYRERVVFVPDTVFVDIPPQTAERTTPDSVSVLENDFARSEARITSDGLLFHNLETKPQQIAKPIEVPVVEKELKESRAADKTNTKTVTKTEYVPRDYSWWDRTRFYGFYAAIIFLIITYRRNLFNAALRVFRRK